MTINNDTNNIAGNFDLKCLNQLVGDFDVYLQAKNYLQI